MTPWVSCLKNNSWILKLRRIITLKQVGKDKTSSTWWTMGDSQTWTRIKIEHQKRRDRYTRVRKAIYEWRFNIFAQRISIKKRSFNRNKKRTEYIKIESCFVIQHTYISSYAIYSLSRSLSCLTALSHFWSAYRV